MQENFRINHDLTKKFNVTFGSSLQAEIITAIQCSCPWIWGIQSRQSMNEWLNYQQQNQNILKSNQ